MIKRMQTRMSTTKWREEGERNIKRERVKRVSEGQKRYADLDVHGHVAWSLNYRRETRYKYVCGREQQWYSGLRNARTREHAPRLRPSMLPSRSPFSPFSRVLHVPNEDSFPSSPFPFSPSNCCFAHACLPLVSHFCRFSFLTFKRKLVLRGRKERGGLRVFRKSRSIVLSYAPPILSYLFSLLFFLFFFISFFVILLPFLSSPHHARRF